MPWDSSFLILLETKNRLKQVQSWGHTWSRRGQELQENILKQMIAPPLFLSILWRISRGQTCQIYRHSQYCFAWHLIFMNSLNLDESQVSMGYLDFRYWGQFPFIRRSKCWELNNLMLLKVFVLSLPQSALLSRCFPDTSPMCWRYAGLAWCSTGVNYWWLDLDVRHSSILLHIYNSVCIILEGWQAQTPVVSNLEQDGLKLLQNS